MITKVIMKFMLKIDHPILTLKGSIGFFYTGDKNITSPASYFIFMDKDHKMMIDGNN